MMHRIRHVAYVGLGALALGLPFSARALAFISDDYKDDVAKTGLSATKTPPEIAINIIQISLGTLALIAVILVLMGGFQWMTSGGVEEKVKKAKKLLIAALIGLALVLASYGIAQYAFLTLYTATG